jgi:GTPase SAR1 family protein
MQMKILMTPHNGCYNHGCEAIVRSTIDMFDRRNEFYLYSADIENDKKFGLDKICTLIPNNSGKSEISKWRYYSFILKEKLFSGDRDLEEISYRNKSALFDSRNTFVLSIGGDNYCYGGMQHVLSEQLKVFLYNHMQCGLWGCSLEEKLLTKNIVDDLKKYQLITVRESISQELLHRNGISDTVILCSDPAFTLRKENTTEYDQILNDNNTIGINISALMNKYDSYPDATYKNFYELIQEILLTTDYNILLIPHVRQFGNDDLVVINKLANELHSDRVTVVSNDYNCMQLKDIISKCRMFVGCRTHATIAAYSTCVPTLVVGYSTKARGICKDLFGTYDGLLIDAREFKTDYDLSKQFSVFLQNEGKIRSHLHTVMPEYIQRAYRASEAIEKMGEKR